MTNYSFDIIFIIILALLVAFIIGFNILQLIDNKLTNININLPTSLVDRIVDNNGDTNFYIKDIRNNSYESFNTDNKTNTKMNTTEVISPLSPQNIENSSIDSQSTVSASSDNDSIYLNCNIKMVTQNNSPLLKLDDQKSMDTINVDGFDQNKNLALI